MRATKHAHISPLGNLSITSSDKKGENKNKAKQNKYVFAKVQRLVVLAQLTAPGPGADQQRRR